MINNLPTIQETWVLSLGQEDCLEKGMATHSGILAWRLPSTEDPGGLQSMRSWRVRHDWATNTFSLFFTSSQNGFLSPNLYFAWGMIQGWEWQVTKLEINFPGRLVSLCYAKSLQLCLTLCDPIDGSPSGSPIPGILQARTLEWVAISFSNAWKWKVKVKPLSRVWLFATPWTAAYQAPLSMGFSRQEYWSGVPLPSPYQV